MRAIGALLIAAGLIWATIAFNISTTVEAGGERIGSGAFAIDIPRVTVNNLGLMEQRRNHLMMSGVAILAGILLFGFGSPSRPELRTTDENHRVCPYCAEQIKDAAKVCRYCQRELPTPAAEEAAADLAHQLAVEQGASETQLRQLIEARKPKGLCPNCDAKISLDSAVCPKCTASFQPGSSWRVKAIQ